ncbi:hypothetical protein SDC9_84324 [bioreactor metagenome]|uniref:Uncharacterized protein n=1 Tax=bioreactor metagenome TaxID=1076179 RepID=A0A644Z9X4_9ZZZZ
MIYTVYCNYTISDTFYKSNFLFCFFKLQIFNFCFKQGNYLFRTGEVFVAIKNFLLHLVKKSTHATIVFLIADTYYKST